MRTHRYLMVTRLIAWNETVIACSQFVLYGIVGWAVTLSMMNTGSMAHAGDPSILGHHPLSQNQAGRLWIEELRCAACHSGIAPSHRPEKTAPDLSEVGTRVSSDYLKAFLVSPSTAHPGTTMPDMLDSLPGSERLAVAESLTHFLIASSRPNIAPIPKEAFAKATSNQKLGRELFHSIGCVACHGPQDLPSETLDSQREEDEDDEEEIDPEKAARNAIKPSVVNLGHVSAKYSVQSLSAFLFQPLQVRSSGRMPDMKLTPDESLAIAEYLMGESRHSIDPLVPSPELVEAGKKHFQALNCTACHSLPGPSTLTADRATKIAWNRDNLSQGCLSTEPASRLDSKLPGNSPRFQLNSNQISAITAAIRSEQEVESDRDELAMKLTAFRCIHCHVRDDYGGVHDAHNSFFQGSQLQLGDDGRIPPPLTLMGAKLQPTWFKKVLFDGESVRHYMATRMPQYGEKNLSDLPALFHRLDSRTDSTEQTEKGSATLLAMRLPSPESRNEEEREREKSMRDAGRTLIGDQGANCIACHTFNGKAASVHQGIDLLTTTERLQPAWFQRYLQNPRAFRPRTVMPSAWPDGVATFKTILDGDTHRQIESIWYYLSLGTSAADPSGVRAVGTKRMVGETAVLHRGRSRVAGFRGIAVGLPERLHYAFNAETGTLSAIWEGEFINVNWSGQGSGDFNPASRAIQLAQDVSFASLEDETAAWPLLPVMTKEAPTNPNPLYPKNVGYQFRGYFLDELAIPTFQYRSGGVNIEDRTAGKKSDENRLLQRVLTFDSESPQALWFRAMVGDLRQESDRVFRSDRLRLTLPTSETRLRSLPDDPKQSELLLRLSIPQGKSTLEFLYEPLK